MKHIVQNISTKTASGLLYLLMALKRIDGRSGID